MFYVTVRDGEKRHGLLVGPCQTHSEALSYVDAARDAAESNDPYACFYAYGTAQLDTDNLGHVPSGVLNNRVGFVPVSERTEPTELFDCPSCWGVGELMAGVDCPYCKGSGFVDSLETYCTRCGRMDTDARQVHFPISDETIQLCTDCEPENVAVSSFELWNGGRFAPMAIVLAIFLAFGLFGTANARPAPEYQPNPCQQLAGELIRQGKSTDAIDFRLHDHGCRKPYTAWIPVDGEKNGCWGYSFYLWQHGVETADRYRTLMASDCIQYEDGSWELREIRDAKPSHAS